MGAQGHALGPAPVLTAAGLTGEQGPGAGEHCCSSHRNQAAVAVEILAIRHRCRHNSGSSRGRNESHPNGTAFTGHLSGHGVGFTNFVTPETTTHGNDGQFSHDDSSTDSSGNLFGAFNAKANMTIGVSNSNKSLETSTLSGTGLFLHRHDLQDFILERWA